MLGKAELLAWFRAFFDDAPSRGEGAPSKALVPPGTPSTISAGCNANPCFVCELRRTIEQTLMRDRRLEGALRRDAEERERKAKAKAGKGGGAPALVAAMPERPLGSQPLELHLIGLRREGSISDEFDDRMLVLTRLPDVETAARMKEGVEAELLASLQRAAEANPKAVKVVSCASGPWLVGMFAISTDPGLAARKEDLRASLAAIEAQFEENRRALEAARKRKGELHGALQGADERLGQAKEAFEAAKTRSKGAKDAYESEYGKSRKTRPELTRLKEDADARRADAKRAANDLAEATRKQGAAKRDADAAAKLVKRHEDEGPKLDKKRTDRKAAYEAALASQAKTAVPLADENEGWLKEGRALMLPGHYASKYRYFIHLTSTPGAFAKNTSLTALTPDTELHGLRAYSGRHIRANAGSFKAGELVGELRRPRAPPRRFLEEEGSLVVTLAGGKVTTLAVRDAASGKETPLADDDVVLLRRNVGGTNIHRAHNAPGMPGADGRLHGPAKPTEFVSVWSEGCQVFPSSDDFNLFITLCALSKRWRCVSGKKDCGVECKVLEVGSGEEALVKAFGKPFLDRAADENRRKANPEVEETIQRIEALNWNENTEGQAALSALLKKKANAEAKGGTLAGQDASDLSNWEARRAHKRTQTEEEELARHNATREEWRREYLREKVQRLAADHLRLCDVAGKCHQRFSYTLLELPSPEIDVLEASLAGARNAPWKGTLA